MDMNEKDHELMWKFIDGDCEAEEFSYVQKKLDVDPLFHNEWKEKLILHEALKEIDYNQPSLRFVKNVMEALPAGNFKLTIPPLVPKSTIWRVIYGSIAFTAMMIFAGWGNDPITAQLLPGERSYSQLTALLIGIPGSTWQIIMAVSLGFLVLIGMDYFLSKKFNR